MMFTQRSYQKELLDEEDIPFKDILLNLQELNFINTWLGGHAITTKGLAIIAGNKKAITVCEIGCGGGDNLAAIQQFCRAKNIDVQLIGIDIKAACIEVAQSHPLLQHNTRLICSDYALAQMDPSPDIIFSSLFCHHFSDEQLTEQLRWMQQQSVLGFFINDLQRHWLAYRLIKILTRLFSASYLVKNDAPLSVQRGFIKKDWTTILTSVGIAAQIHWRWAFRYLIVHTKEKKSNDTNL